MIDYFFREELDEHLKIEVGFGPDGIVVHEGLS